jgi:hypothetical protein
MSISPIKAVVYRYRLWSCVFALTAIVNVMLALVVAHYALKPQPHYVVHVSPERTAP